MSVDQRVLSMVTTSADADQDPSAPVRIPVPPLRRSGRLGSTPARLVALATTVVLACAVLAALAAVGASGQRAGLDVIGGRDAPEVIASADLYFALNDMDAQVANVLLVGDEQDLGFTAAQAQAIFEQRRHQADADLQQAASSATDPMTAATIRSLLDDYGRYEALVARALLLDSQHPHAAGQPSPDALAAYRDATDLLDGTLLPAARTLADRNAAALDATYQHQRTQAVTMGAAVAVAGVLTVVALVVLQLFTTRRFRRWLNPWMLAATIGALSLTIGGVVLLATQHEQLRAAKQDAFDSILALDRARAVSYDANADESRYLVDPQRAAQYQAAFLTKTLQLVDLPGATIDTFDQRFASALAAYNADHADVGWRGFYGTEFRNITFVGERTAAQRMLALYYDRALTALIAINQNAFTETTATAHRDLRGWTVIPWVGLAVVAGLLAAGAQRRLREYR